MAPTGLSPPPPDPHLHLVEAPPSLPQQRLQRRPLHVVLPQQRLVPAVVVVAADVRYEVVMRHGLRVAHPVG